MTDTINCGKCQKAPATHWAIYIDIWSDDVPERKPVCLPCGEDMRQDDCDCYLLHFLPDQTPFIPILYRRKVE